MPQRNLPTNYSPSRSRINHPSGYPRVGYQFQRSICPSGSSNLPTDHSLNGAGRNTPHQQLPGQRMTEIHRQRTEYSPDTTRPSYAQVAQLGHAMANAYDATNWARDFPVYGTAQSQDPTCLDNYTSNSNGCYSEVLLETFFDTPSYYNGASSTLLSREGFSHNHQERVPQHNKMASKKPTMSRTPAPTDLNIPGDINSHEPPWSIMNRRVDQGPTMPQPQGMQRLGLDPSIPSTSTKTTTTTTSTSIQCPYCPKCFTGKHGKGNLGRHKRQIHVSGPQSFKCERGCERSYARKDARLKHYKKHHQEQGYYLSGLTNL